jgi:hypothetical protein
VSILNLFLKQLSRFFSVYYNFRYKRNRAFEHSILKGSSRRSSSSTSDTSEFREINSLYSSSDIMFNKFRRSFHYSKILEHVDYETGLLYIKQINLLKPDYDLINRFKFALRNEKGKPHKFLFRTFGWSSPSTIRYIKIYLEIKRIFNGVNFKRIVEIGGVWGTSPDIFPHRRFSRIRDSRFT